MYSSPIQPHPQSTCLRPTTTDEIEKIISHLRDSAAGDDQNKSRIPKKATLQLGKPVSKIINLLLKKRSLLSSPEENTNVQSKG